MRICFRNTCENELLKHQKKFCSHSCSAMVTVRKTPRICERNDCDNTTKTQRNIYCSNSCKSKSMMLGEFLKRWIVEHPIEFADSQRLGSIRSMRNRNSKPQQALLGLLSSALPVLPVSEYYVKTANTHYFIDIAFPDLKVGVEYDGKKWHKNPNLYRDCELIDQGWTMIHVRNNEVLYIACREKDY